MTALLLSALVSVLIVLIVIAVMMLVYMRRCGASAIRISIRPQKRQEARQ